MTSVLKQMEQWTSGCNNSSQVIASSFPNKNVKDIWLQASARKRPRRKETPGPAVTRNQSVFYIYP